MKRSLGFFKIVGMGGFTLFGQLRFQAHLFGVEGFSRSYICSDRGISRCLSLRRHGFHQAPFEGPRWQGFPREGRSPNISEERNIGRDRIIDAKDSECIEEANRPALGSPSPAQLRHRCVVGRGAAQRPAVIRPAVRQRSGSTEAQCCPPFAGRSR